MYSERIIYVFGKYPQQTPTWHLSTGYNMIRNMCTEITSHLTYIPNLNLHQSHTAILSLLAHSEISRKRKKGEPTMASISLSSMASGILVTNKPASMVDSSKPTTMVASARRKSGRRMVVVVRSAPDKLSEKVEQSIKAAKETCAENPESGECAAAWDEVEEVSAAASHARDKKKASDPLENYCMDNPETDECRTYDS